MKYLSKRSCTLGIAVAMSTIVSETARANVILNAPDTSVSGFYNDNTYDYGDSVNNLKLAEISSATLTAVNGFQGLKLFGSATLTRSNPDEEPSPTILLLASGTASGTVTSDTVLKLNFLFEAQFVSDLPRPYFVHAILNTSIGDFDTGELDGITGPGQVSGTVDFLYNGFSAQDHPIPAGTEIQAWSVAFGLGDYGVIPGPDSLTLSIPQNSIDLVAQAAGVVVNPPDPPTTTPTPEPSTWFMLSAGVAACALGSKKRGGRCS